MLKKQFIISIAFILTGFITSGQTTPDTTEFFRDGYVATYCKADNFKNSLFIIDTLTLDTLEFDHQISKNSSLSILYENNKPKYKFLLEAYYDKEAKKTRRAERHHNFQHKLPRKLRFKHKICFFPTFYYGKSPKIKRTRILRNNKWENYSGKSLKPKFALFDSNTIPFQTGSSKF